MAGFIEGVDRGQSTLFPESGWRTGSARIISSASSIFSSMSWICRGLASSARPRHGRGGPGYHPAVLLKLFIYGYLNRSPPAVGWSARPGAMSR
jgi:hypothetical protein